MQKLFLVISIGFLLFNNVINANEVNDSLIAVYQNEKQDTDKVKSIHQYILINYSHPDSAIKYSKIAIELLKKTENITLLAKSYNLLAVSYYYHGDLKRSEDNLNKSLSFYLKINNKKGIATCYNGIGVIYYDQGKLYRALQLYVQSLRIKKKLGDQKSIAMTLNNLGNVYKDLNNFEKSVEYYKKSLEIKREINDQHGIAMTLNNIGLLYHNNKRYKNALEYYSESIGIKREIDDLHGLAMSLNNIGLTYELQQNYPKALHFYEESILIKKEIGDQYGLAMSLINLGTVYREVGNYSNCFKLLMEGERIAKEINATTQLKDCYQRLYETYEMQDNTSKAFKYYKLYIDFKDSVMSGESIKNIQKLQAQYEDEAKQLTIQNLSKKEELNNAQLAKNRAEKNSKNIAIISLIVGLAFSVGLIIFFYFIFKQRTNKNLALKKSLDEKEVLFKEVHHRVKNNFQVISSLLNLHSNNTDNEAVQKALGEARDRVVSMALVHEKLYQSTDLTQIKMDEYISQLIVHLKESFNSKVDFSSIIKTDNVYLNIETAIPLGLIFNELITNSIKYAFKAGLNNAIEVIIIRKEDKVRVEYKDNGIGLPKGFDIDNLDSLGLNLVQILVLQIHGELAINNEKGVSFSFEFTLPG